MKSSILLWAASAALVIGTVSAQADILVYDFETTSGSPAGPDGFRVNAGSVTSVAQSTTGATQGTFAMQVVAPATGFNNGNVLTANFPAALTTATKFSYDLTVDESAENFGNVWPAWFISAPDGLDMRLDADTTQPGNNFNFGGQNLVKQNETQTLAAFTDPVSGATDQTIAQIIANDQVAHPGESVNFFALEFQNGANGTNSTLSYFIDNVTVPGAIPEPASLGAIALGGLTMVRRRRAC